MPRTTTPENKFATIQHMAPHFKRLGPAIVSGHRKITVYVCCGVGTGFTNVELNSETLQLYSEKGEVVAFRIVRAGMPTLCWPTPEHPRNKEPHTFLSAERLPILSMNLPLDLL